MFCRLFVHSIFAWWNGKGFFVHLSQSLKQHYPFRGVPCGGIGCGGIGRDFRGGFCKFSLLPGIAELNVDTVKADQFIVSIHRQDSGQCVFQKALSCVPQDASILSKWDFSFSAVDLHYRGLYPRSWTLYEITEFDISLMCRQVSPVLPHNYTDTSLPVCLFIWTIKNNSSIPYIISITFTFRNGTGNKDNEKSVCRSELFETTSCSGIKLRHTLDSSNLCYALAVKNHKNIAISNAIFDPKSDGNELWQSLHINASFNHGKAEAAKEFSELGVAICAKICSDPHSLNDVEFVLAWDMPLIKFCNGRRVYKRWYAKSYNKKMDSAEHLCSHAFQSYKDWEEQIERWQNKVLEDQSLPDWYKSALFNELYYMTDGGTCWVEYDESWRMDEVNMSDETVEHFKKFGRFAYLESWDYLMMNTFDVHFYSSYAFLVNWPQIELSIQLDYADQLFHCDSRKTANFYEGTLTQVKKYGRIPHDMGSPTSEPWLNTNAYMLSDTCEWKDLNLKFVMACYRDYMLIVSGSEESDDRKQKILQRFFNLSKSVEEDFSKFDVDGDEMIENGGGLDQTYDAWVMNGTSAYCGGLWLGALESCRAMAEALHQLDYANSLSKKLSNARSAYEKKLWNGSYFDFDEKSPHHQTIMADQLCAFWYISTINCTINNVLMDEEKMQKAMDTIFNKNLKMFANGSLGPVNGMTPSGSVDLSSMQSEEVWGGTAYSLASFEIILNKQHDRAFQIAEGWYRSCWERFGLQYQTPEAIFETKYYRAVGYMRPLAIWAMQWALDHSKKL